MKRYKVVLLDEEVNGKTLFYSDEYEDCADYIRKHCTDERIYIIVPAL